MTVPCQEDIQERSPGVLYQLVSSFTGACWTRGAERSPLSSVPMPNISCGSAVARVCDAAIKLTPITGMSIAARRRAFGVRIFVIVSPCPVLGALEGGTL